MKAMYQKSKGALTILLKILKMPLIISVTFTEKEINLLCEIADRQ